MRKLPKMILVVGIIRYTNKHEIVDILKEYFNGVPYIDYTDYTTNKQIVYYILQDSRVIKKFVHKVYTLKKSVDKILDYYYYYLKENSSEYLIKYTYFPAVGSVTMPKKIELDTANLEKLRLF